MIKSFNVVDSNILAMKVKIMKKSIIFMVISVLFFLSSCYNDDKNATVRINLGNIPIAKNIEQKSVFEKLFSIFIKSAHAQALPQDFGVIEIHLAALDGNKVIAKTALDTNGMTSNIVLFSVPAGDKITILVVGENSSNVAAYYGYNEVDLDAGETSEVTIAMNEAVWSQGSTIFTDSWSPHILSWTGSGVPTKYVIIDDMTEVILYNGYGTTAEVPESSNSFRFYVDFWMFDLKTVEAGFNDT